MMWKAVPGYSNYECTESGLVRSIDHVVHNDRGYYRKKGKIITASKQQMGSAKLHMVDDLGTKTSMTPQRVVFMTWHGAIPEGCGVTFRNKDPNDFRKENLVLRHAGNHIKKSDNVIKQPVWELDGFCQIMQDVNSMRWPITVITGWGLYP